MKKLKKKQFWIGLIENSRREKMGKKYLETKKDTLESSILGVWKTAIEEGDARMDGRTAEYREHRKKLESARQRRESKRVTKEEVEPKEEVELVNITPDQIEEAFILLDEQQIVLGEGTFTEEQIEIIDVLQEMTEEEHDELLDQMDDDQLEMYEGILGAIGRGIKKGAKRFGTKQGRAGAKLKKAQKKQTLAKTKAATVAAKADTKATKKATRKAAADAGIGIRGKATKAAKAVGGAVKKGAKKAGAAIKKSAEEVELDEKHDTHVNPKDREELGTEPSDTAKKMKRSKEPAAGQMTEAQSGGKEEYQKFFNAALKKFKVSSPADLKGDDKKKFYDYVDKNWEGDNEKAEGAMSQVREFKIQSMKAALAQVWGMEEGKNPFKKEDDEKEVVKNGKTETGKKAAVIDIKPKIKD
jgi:hypothetical protein